VSLAPSIRESRAYYCLDCGKCTAVCPVALHDENFSPRLLVYTRVSGQADRGEAAEKAPHRLAQCLTCGLCTRRCPSDVDYNGFARLSRGEEFAGAGTPFPCSHGGALESLHRLMARDGKGQRRLDWVPKGAPAAETGDLVYFSGCLPFFDAYFTHLESDSSAIARSSLRLLSGLGETPALMSRERCCGHDLYWSGDEATAAELARRNAESIAATGATRLVASCPECAHMLRDVYPTLGVSLDVEVMHLSEYLAGKLETGELSLRPLAETVSFHDSCRLSRQLRAGDAARAVLNRIYGDDFREFERHGEEAPCCGTNGWLHCDAVSRQLQETRLKEAVERGAETLVTACPKCQLHFRCAQEGDADDELKGLKVRDLATVAAEAMDGGENPW